MANASQCPPTNGGSVAGQPLCDPINGREWATNKGDLQFACIFDLRPSTAESARTAREPQYQGACDCATGALNAGTQLCDSATPTLQVYGKAYPSVREMIIAKAMSTSTAGNQGIVSSLCPIHVSDRRAAPTRSSATARRSTRIIDRLKNSLSNQCLPQKLSADSVGASCPASSSCSSPRRPGRARAPTPAARAIRRRASSDRASSRTERRQPTLHAGRPDEVLPVARGRVHRAPPGAPGDPDTYPACALPQLTTGPNPNDFDSTGSCAPRRIRAGATSRAPRQRAARRRFSSRTGSPPPARRCPCGARARPTSDPATPYCVGDPASIQSWNARSSPGARAASGGMQLPLIPPSQASFKYR